MRFPHAVEINVDPTPGYRTVQWWPTGSYLRIHRRLDLLLAHRRLHRGHGIGYSVECRCISVGIGHSWCQIRESGWFLCGLVRLPHSEMVMASLAQLVLILLQVELHCVDIQQYLDILYLGKPSRFHVWCFPSGIHISALACFCRIPAHNLGMLFHCHVRQPRSTHHHQHRPFSNPRGLFYHYPGVRNHAQPNGHGARV